jgi:hypothetical protein
MAKDRDGKQERKPDQPTAPHRDEAREDAVERDKQAMRKADEQARRTKRPGASGKRGSTSED